MTKLDFLTKLETELNRKNVPDAADVVEEYEQHFTFKLTDGYSEEEIAAKLGDPAEIAAQYDAPPAAENGGRKVITAVGLGVADFFFAILCVLLIAWEIVMAALVLSCTVAAVCLIGNLAELPVVLIPSMPYHCAFVFGLAFLALAVLAVAGTVYFGGFIRRLMRAFARFHKAARASASGKSALPPHAASAGDGLWVSAHSRVMKTVSLLAVTALAVCLFVGFAMSAVSAGAIEFWHTWGWFQNV